jgi:hypothetical protein
METVKAETVLHFRPLVGRIAAYHRVSATCKQQVAVGKFSRSLKNKYSEGGGSGRQIRVEGNVHV